MYLGGRFGTWTWAVLTGDIAVGKWRCCWSDWEELEFRAADWPSAAVGAFVGWADVGACSERAAEQIWGFGEFDSDAWAAEDSGSFDSFELGAGASMASASRVSSLMHSDG